MPEIKVLGWIENGAGKPVHKLMTNREPFKLA